MNEISNCDMCGSKIIDNKCSCGTWKSKEEMENCPMRKAIEEFHDMKRFTLTGDAPHLGCAVVFFRGDYEDCKKVQKFIYSIKNRPYYDGDE
jgi:hypothetical protein